MSDEDEINKLNDIILGERVFLHDLSNCLLVAQGMGNFVLQTLKKTAGEDAKEYARMVKVNRSVDKMIGLVQERRIVLKSDSN